MSKPQISIYVVAVLLLIDFLFFGYLPSHQRYKAVKQAQKQQNAILVQASARGSQLPRLRQQLKDARQLVAHYDKNIPTDRALGAFLQQIANLMTEHSLSEQAVVPGKEIRSDNTCCIPVDIQCKGGLSRIFGFFSQLQMLDRFVRIERIDLTNDANFSGRVTMETKAVIYYRPQDISEPDLVDVDIQ